MTAPRPFDRTDSQSARLVAKTLFPDPKVRRTALSILKWALQVAHEIDEQSWGITLRRDKVQLNVGRGEALSLSSGGIEFLSLKNAPGSQAKTEAGKRRSLPGSLRVRLEGEFWGTPVLAGNRLYSISQKGKGQVVEMSADGKKGEIVGTGQLEGEIMSSPAIADGALYVRGDGTLWKIAAP